MTRVRAAALVTSAAFLFAGLPLAASSHTLTLGDLRREVGISDPRFTPDGRSVVFVESRLDFNANTTVTELVSVDTSTGALHPLTRGRSDVSSPRWSPDGQRLAFLADGGDAE